MTEWETIKLPKEMANKIEEYTKTKFAEERGYTSKSQVVVAAVRNFLDRERELVFHMDSKKYNKKLSFRKVGRFIFCEECNSEVCKHAIHLQKHKKYFDFDHLNNDEIIMEREINKKD